MMRRILIVLENGPDIRQFAHSGLAADLVREARVTWALGHKTSERQLPETDEKIRLSDIAQPLPGPLRLISRLAERACNAHEQRRGGHGQWVNFLDTLRARKTSAMKQRLDALLSHAPVHRVLVALERLLFRVWPVPRSALASLNPDTIVLSNHATPGACGLLWLAKRSGIRTVVMQNSWKDSYARTHVPVAPDVFIVPLQEAADLLVRANPGLSAGIQVRDTLHTTQLADPGKIMGREAFCALYNLDPARPILCLSAAAPNAVLGEPEIVSDLVSRLKGGVQLLIRLNPMEDKPDRWEALAKQPRVVLQTPDWDYAPAGKWSEPRSEDGSIWASTIAHCAFNISVPSTVTRDFLLFGKPVVNICFDAGLDSTNPESNLRYWNAPFYRVYREHDLIRPSFSQEDLVNNVESALKDGYELGGFPLDATAAESRALAVRAVLADSQVYKKNLRTKAPDCRRTPKEKDVL